MKCSFKGPNIAFACSLHDAPLRLMNIGNRTFQEKKGKECGEGEKKRKDKRNRSKAHRDIMHCEFHHMLIAQACILKQMSHSPPSCSFYTLLRKAAKCLTFFCSRHWKTKLIIYCLRLLFSMCAL